MSGGWTLEEIRQAKKLGVHVFKKPFKIEEIYRWLEDCQKQIAPGGKLTDLSELDLGPQTKKKAKGKNAAP
jgi:hypothetical protein